MNKNMIETAISVDQFSKDIKATTQPGIFRGPVGHDNHSSDSNTINKNASSVCGLSKISEKTLDYDQNIAIDLFTSICTNIEKTVSDIFKKRLFPSNKFIKVSNFEQTVKMKMEKKLVFKII
jgi:hypothetical protein